MMRAWINILPLFIVRYLAIRYGERFDYRYEGRIQRVFAQATKDCFFKIDTNDRQMKITDDMLTEWFSPFTPPKIIGVYEVENIRGTGIRFFSHWNLDGWAICDITPDLARRNADFQYRVEYRRWRGLKEKHHG